MEMFTWQIILPIVARMYASQLPVYVVWLVGLIYAMRMVKHQQRGARAALWAVVIQFTNSIIFTPLFFLVTWFLIRRGTDEIVINNINTGLGLVSYSLSALAWGIMLVALLRPSTSGVTAPLRATWVE